MPRALQQNPPKILGAAWAIIDLHLALQCRRNCAAALAAFRKLECGELPAATLLMAT
jgi:hypothetical protein